jgi:hypothetical protein
MSLNQGSIVQSADEETLSFSDRGILENGLYPIAESKKVVIGLFLKCRDSGFICCGNL